MAAEFDIYTTLGVSPTATLEDIKLAYRRAARRLHPDINQSHPGAVPQFQDISIAYETLLDDRQRKAYDQQQEKEEKRPQFLMRATPSKRAIAPLNETQVLYLLLEIIPEARIPEAKIEKAESHLNLTLVLDHSNSMKGARLEKVKIAAHQIIDQLTPNDIFSVVGFNDFAEVLVPAAQAAEKANLKARVSMMLASGSTEIFQGLSQGITENRKYLAPRLVNHVILLTDGHTYTDHARTVELAREAAKEGISISAMGLGQEWNDQFLDEIASITGGHCAYIQSASAVVRFLNDHVRSLSNTYAERMQLSIAPDPDVKLEYVFRLSPNPQPLDMTQSIIPLGGLQNNRTISVMIQLEMPHDLKEGFRSVVRLVAVGDIFAGGLHRYQTVSDLSMDVLRKPVTEEPPAAIIDALGKLMLYRMQEKAQDAFERGDMREATHRLQQLSTRSLQMGEVELSHRARSEAERVSKTNMLSSDGQKALKFQTRMLLSSPDIEDSAE